MHNLHTPAGRRRSDGRVMGRRLRLSPPSVRWSIRWLQRLVVGLALSASLVYSRHGNALRLTHLSVPSVVLLGQGTWLNCSYEQGEDVIYSLKWYKDNVEILGFMPLEPESGRLKTFNLSGVYIDMDVSRVNPANIYLSRTDRFSEGRYRCEISGDGPHFRTARAHKYMNVVAIPDNGLLVSGVSEHHVSDVGDLLNVSCSFGPSKPNATLDWFINEIRMPAGAEHTLESRSASADGQSMVTKTLTFTVTPSHFWRGKMKLRCSSLVRVEFNVSSEEIKMRQRGAVVEVSGRMDGPLVFGLQNYYEYPVDRVRLTCRTQTYDDPNRTPLRLMWLVNDREITNPHIVKSYQKMEENVTHTFLELNFRLGDPAFSWIAKGQDTKLRCASTEVIEYAQDVTRVIHMRQDLHSSESKSVQALQNHESRILGFLAVVYSRFVSANTNNSGGSLCPASLLIFGAAIIIFIRGV